ncbi:hypothetical protein EBT31_18830 [bacterium]|jgi:hypothetical protein|nr:hypothetical protein [bacterium]
MTENSMVPFYRSYLLNGRIVYLDKLSELSDAELNMLNIETLASLEEARRDYASVENKQSEEGGSVYRRLKVAGYFQAAIKLELENG